MTGATPVASAAGPQDGRKVLTLRRGLVAIPAGDALLIEGGQRRRLLRGGPMSSVLPCVPSLLPMLTGGCSAERICLETGLDPAVLGDLLRLLGDAGLLERAAVTAPPGTGVAEQAETFLSRTASTAEDPARSGGELSDELARSAVVILGPPAVGGQIAADLTDIGVGSVLYMEDARRIPPAAWQTLRSATHRAVAIFDGALPGRTAEDPIEAARRLSGPGLPILRFAGDSTVLEIGPTFYGTHPACPSCFRRGYADLAMAPEAGQGASPGGPDGPEAAVLAALVAGELTAQLSRLTVPAPPRRLTRITVPGYRAEYWDVTPEPGCDVCGISRGSAGAAAAETYEWLESSEPVGLASWRMSRGSAELRDYARRVATHDDMPTAPRLAVQDTSSERLDSAAATILSGSVAGGHPTVLPGSAARRAAPDGDLTGVYPYLLTNGDLVDLPGHIFKYDSMSDELVAARADRIPLAAALDHTGLTPAQFSFAVVLVAAVGALRFQYRSAALRLAHLDAGQAAARLAAAAAACGREVTFAASWSGALADLLELDPAQEIIAAVAGIHGRRDEGA